MNSKQQRKLWNRQARRKVLAAFKERKAAEWMQRQIRKRVAMVAVALVVGLLLVSVAVIARADENCGSTIVSLAHTMIG